MAKKKTAAKKKTKPAAKSLHAKRFPGESARYRGARDTLLKAEMRLRSEIEAVATDRR
jgi:predicted dithiol-disulfide oxidoreductase (DUF899 family)